MNNLIAENESDSHETISSESIVPFGKRYQPSVTHPVVIEFLNLPLRKGIFIKDRKKIHFSK